MKNNVIEIGENLQEISDKAIENFLDIYNRTNGQMKVAFSGGSTPKLFFEGLSNANIDWKRIEIFLVDERNVHHHSEDSNYHLLNKTLLNKIDIPDSNIHAIQYNKDINKSTKLYLHDLVGHFNLNKGEYPEFDFILLGMGDDGHTASLFPETFDPFSKKIVISISNLERIEYDRISLGMKVINNSRNTIFLISGDKKSEICKEVFENINLSYPASHVEPKGNFTIYLDKAAASKL